jgi:glycosyltransferase involved in cell wall biosynthesis
LNFRRLAINVKFLTAGPTGVHRVAEQLINQVAENLHEFTDLFQMGPELVAPTNLSRTTYNIFNVERRGLFHGQLWEQLDLPRLTRPDLLLNLCNLGPMSATSAITMIHDAQVFSSPDSYKPSFGRWYRAVQPVLGHRHSRILTISNYSAGELVRFGVASRERIAIVPNGVDHLLPVEPDREIIDRLGLQKLGFVVGLANAQPHKNIGLLIRAFAAPALADLKLVLVGPAVRKDFERVGPVSSNVIFAGRVRDEELRSLLEAALCIGFPSTTEGFGLPPLEGMTLGCPAIVAPCGALPEVCGPAAIYADARVPEEWVSAIVRLRDNRDLRIRYASSGRTQAALYTWKRAGKALVEVIKELATERLQRSVR